METNKAILKDILEAIYWRSFTDVQKNKVINIIDFYSDENSVSIAGELCDYLEIEKRGNRAAIAEILDKYKTLNP